MNVISWHSDHQHVSATHVAIFRMATTRIHIRDEITVEWFRHILFVFLLLPPWRWPHEWPKWMAETCHCSLYNGITFINQSAFVGLCNKFYVPITSVYSFLDPAAVFIMHAPKQ